MKAGDGRFDDDWVKEVHSDIINGFINLSTDRGDSITVSLTKNCSKGQIVALFISCQRVNDIFFPFTSANSNRPFPKATHFTPFFTTDYNTMVSSLTIIHRTSCRSWACPGDIHLQV